MTLNVRYFVKLGPFESFSYKISLAFFTCWCLVLVVQGRTPFSCYTSLKFASCYCLKFIVLCVVDGVDFRGKFLGMK